MLIVKIYNYANEETDNNYVLNVNIKRLSNSPNESER